MFRVVFSPSTPTYNISMTTTGSTNPPLSITSGWEKCKALCRPFSTNVRCANDMTYLPYACHSYTLNLNTDHFLLFFPELSVLNPLSKVTRSYLGRSEFISPKLGLIDSPAARRGALACGSLRPPGYPKTEEAECVFCPTHLIFSTEVRDVMRGYSRALNQVLPPPRFIRNRAYELISCLL